MSTTPLESVYVKRDGETLAELASENAAFAWLLTHQSNSVAWALNYEGYTVEDAQGNQLMDDYKEAMR